MKLIEAKQFDVGRKTARFIGASVWLMMVMGWVGVGRAADGRPDNVFIYPPALSANLQRVVMLPLISEGQGAGLAEGCEALQPILLEGLEKSKRFEVVSASADILRGGSGRLSWTGAEELPADFFGSLKREYGCDGVLFCQLTVFHAYGPPVIGWRLKLVDARTREILWAVDQVFEANDVVTAKKPWQFLRGPDKSEAIDENRWEVLNSPRQFGQYTVAKVLETLPKR
jgi:hypothetical protein